MRFQTRQAFPLLPVRRPSQRDRESRAAPADNPVIQELGVGEPADDSAYLNVER
jgi:hypothetical protein